MEILPFDLVLFKGRDISSKAVLLVEEVATGNSDYSHIGIIVNNKILPNIPELLNNELYVLECTANLSKLDGPKNIQNKRKFGVQIRDLNSLKSEYNGEVYIGKLISNLFIDSNNNYLINVMDDIYKKYINVSYEINCVDLFSAGFKCCRPIRSVLNKVISTGNKLLLRNYNNKNDPNNMIYCSQLVAIILKSINILPQNIDDRNYLPVDVLGIRDGYIRIVNEIIKIN